MKTGRRAPTPAKFLTTITLFTVIPLLRADDGAASIAAGGIVMAREPRITMQKEVLRIGDSKVRVEYEFRNDTDQDITTEVAFPIPPYASRYEQSSVNIQGFDDFTLTIDGKPVRFQIEAKAKLKGRDISSFLNEMSIDIATFGHIDEDTGYSKDIRRLSAAQRIKLRSLGAAKFEFDHDEVEWTVEKKYFWSQIFPAHTIVHISHEYTPALGSLNTAEPGLLEPRVERGVYARELDTFCIDPPLRKILTGYAKRQDTLVPYSYVDFILTTANTWKTPIEDFTLIVEKPHHQYAKETFVSFCWNGPVVKIDDTHFSAHISNLVPTKELRIGFFDVTSYQQ